MIWSLLWSCAGPIEPPSDSEPGCDAVDTTAVELTIAPYLQSVTPSSAWVLWETDTIATGTVEWGIDEDLGQVSCASRLGLLGAEPDLASTQVHAAELTGLQPDTAYLYRVRTGAMGGELHRFRTPPLSSSEAPTRLVALSDSQMDAANPDRFRQIVQEGVLPTARARYGEDLAEALSMALLPGDLVDNGWSVDEWQQEFFAPAAELLASVPLYPALGNHEGGSPYYLRYFQLPDDGLEEHAYTFRQGNLQVVTLDSNGWREDDQLAWLDGVLASTCDAEEVDFVFAQLHHPYLSELWTPGESDFTAAVVQRLEAFSDRCGKPSVHFFGHTHGYSRGQSRDHDHVMVNVASAGGALDRWGAQAQADYDAFTVSQDTWGFVLVEVQAGDAPAFTLRRFSQGHPEAPLKNVETDALTVLRDNQQPATPTGSEPSCDEAIRLSGSAFSDPEGRAHQGSQWQVAQDCDGFDAAMVDRWRQRQNWFAGVDTQAGDDLEDERFPELSGGQELCWRVRYRDENLGWSDWSPGRLDVMPLCE